MSQARLYIAIPVHNRLAIAEECIPTIRADWEDIRDVVSIYNDSPDTASNQYLARFGDEVHSNGHSIGIERQRRQHFADFWNRKDKDGFTHLYLTDADAMHAPTWRDELLRIQEKYDNPPICGYNTYAHARLPGNTLEDSPFIEDVIWRRVAPGISYLLTRAHVEKVVAWLARNPEDHWNWDWTVPMILGNQFCITRTSYVDHIGYGGYHHPEGEGYDGGDRALTPVLALVAKRAEVVQKLKEQDANRTTH